MGYSIRLEAPVSHAYPLGANLITAFPQINSPEASILLQDGRMFRVETSNVGINIERWEMSQGGGYPDLPVPAHQVAWWHIDKLIDVNGLFYRYSFQTHEWLSEPLPEIPVGTSTGAMSGVKGKYDGN
jgi:hypothetical protein